jgi:CheY-like chemotaxis protein
MTCRTVLIADDDQDLANVLAMRCRELGVNPVLAHDARTAFSLICDSRPDVICLDVNMPAGSGLSVCEMVANDEELRSIPVIILTGRTDETTVRRCHEMCAFYVLKTSNIWGRVQPILCELLGLESAEPRAAEPAQQAVPMEEPPRGFGRGLAYLVEIAASEAPMEEPSGQEMDDDLPPIAFGH